MCRSRLLGAACAALVITCITLPVGATNFTVVDIGTLGGRLAYPHHINASGWVTSLNPYGAASNK